jgi:hypothetical protein
LPKHVRDISISSIVPLKVVLLSAKLITAVFKILLKPAVSNPLRMEAYRCNQVPYHVHNCSYGISSVHRHFSVFFPFSIACFGPDSRDSISWSS